MKRSFWIALLMNGAVMAAAQVASHAPTVATPTPAAVTVAPKVSDKPVARVNGAVLTDRDLLREMYSIFPYARQHNGTFPKQLEPEIRRGALQMIIFEELVYQEAQHRKVAIPAARINAAVTQVREQFGADDFRAYLKDECKGSVEVLRQKIRRSMMIEELLKTEVQEKAEIAPAAVKAYYDKNPANFEHPETFAIQTISIIPPQNAAPGVLQQAQKRAEEVLRKAKATHSYVEFGLLAEKVSDDDWRVNMGDRHTVSAAALPLPLVQAARAMKPGQVSDLIQLGPNYTLFRLNAHTPAGRTPFDEVKAKLQADMRKTKINEQRAELNQRLHKNAKIEIL